MSAPMLLAAVAAPAEVLQYIQALKWPVVVGGGIFLERRALRGFLERFRMPQEGSVKFLGVGEANWKNSVLDVAEKIEEVVAATASDNTNEPIQKGEPVAMADGASSVAGEDIFQTNVRRYLSTSTQWDAIDRLVVTDPTGAVISAWEKLEERIMGKAYIEKANVSQRERRNIVLVASRLGLPRDVVSIVQELRTLRNQVAHGQQRLSSEDALEYVQTVKRVADQILLDTYYPAP
jgi:hypothetical protein